MVNDLRGHNGFQKDLAGLVGPYMKGIIATASIF